MESYPLDWPRLSGRLSYASPTYWRMACAEDSIEIIPARTPNGATVCLISLGLVFLAGTQFALSRLPAFPQKPFAELISIGVALTLIVGSVLIRATYIREQARGPTMVISFARREVCLPREHKSWPFDSVVRWEVVWGQWIRGPDRKPNLYHEQVAELQMIFKDDKGEERAWPIIGTPGPPGRTYFQDDILAVARRIAKGMELPLLLTTKKGSREISVG